MGTVANVSFDRFPKQGTYLMRRVEVCFNYDSAKTVGGMIVRDDAEEPGRMIIKLDNDRYVLSTECMYQLKD